MASRLTMAVNGGAPSIVQGPSSVSSGTFGLDPAPGSDYDVALEWQDPAGAWTRLAGPLRITEMASKGERVPARSGMSPWVWAGLAAIGAVVLGRR